MKARVPQGPSMNAMLKQAQKMQEDMAALQADLEEREYEISAGGGAAKITAGMPGMSGFPGLF